MHFYQHCLVFFEDTLIQVEAISEQDSHFKVKSLQWERKLQKVFPGIVCIRFRNSPYYQILDEIQKFYIEISILIWYQKNIQFPSKAIFQCEYDFAPILICQTLFIQGGSNQPQYSSPMIILKSVYKISWNNSAILLFDLHHPWSG